MRPIDARLQSDEDTEFETVPFDLLVRAVWRASDLSLIVLDASRDNPFITSMYHGPETPFVGRGLARVEPAGNMLITYAANAGTIAADGEGRNSPYTEALLTHLEEPGLEVGFMFRKVRDAVLTSTGGSQQPVVYGDLPSAGMYLGTQPDWFESSEPVTSGHVLLGLAERRGVQMGLQALGFDPGPADGLFGPKTTAAIAAWKEAKGYEPTGLLTREQAEALMAVAAASRPERQIAQPDARTQAHIPTGPFRDCPACPEMMVVPAGSFTMGSPSSEDGRDDSEGPLRRVTIPAPLAVGKYEVTFGEWDACVAAGGCRSYRPDDEGWGRGQHPVTNVSWEDAKAYVDWLSRTTGKRYRLLTEAEWEYAARAGTQTSRYWGDSTRKQCNHANGFDDSAKNEVDQVFWRAAQCDDRSRYTSHSGQFGESSFGLSDMLGNVREWVEDCWHHNYAGAPSDGSAWTSAGDCTQRVLRGGYWGNYPESLRAASRAKGGTEVRHHSNGIRVAREPVH